MSFLIRKLPGSPLSQSFHAHNLITLLLPEVGPPPPPPRSPPFPPLSPSLLINTHFTLMVEQTSNLYKIYFMLKIPSELTLYKEKKLLNCQSFHFVEQHIDCASLLSVNLLFCCVHNGHGVFNMFNSIRPILESFNLQSFF